MTKLRSNYVLESCNESERLDRQSKMAAFDFKVDLQFLKVHEGDKVLDAGCGSGIVSNHVATLVPGVSVVGWDASRDRIEAAKAKYGSAKNVSFVQKNLLELSPDSEKERFDSIVCRFVLRHFSSADTERVIRNLYGVLKPGGTLYCVDVEGILGEIFPASQFLKKTLVRMREAKALNLQVARKMPSLLMKHGFQSVDWTVMVCLFKGEELAQEVDNLKQSVKSSEEFFKRVVGGEENFARFKEEYFATLQSPGFVLCYNKVVAIGTKPKTNLQLVSG